MAHYKTTINGTRLYLEVLDGINARGWAWVDGSEQCDDCGSDDWKLLRDGQRIPDAIRCEHCGTCYDVKHVVR